MRLRIAEAAARIMAEEGVRDYGAAKRKAAARLGASRPRHLPTNQEVAEALLAYQRLFAVEAAAERQALLALAADTMRLLAPFEPRLVGPVLAGATGAHAVVELHLFSEPPEEVAFFLLDRGIRYEEDERRLRPRAGAAPEPYPLFRIHREAAPVELVVLPLRALRQAPVSPVDGRPMARASLRAVLDLLAAAAADQPR
ncbi:hypothetical protein [Inmirania thermothiophila]|uniref:Nucleotidyltransferase-like protein n=1 Tax=Inmirania thermothiophila TaxID=1750597 RepID=A0A3N1Y9Q4_9GAMM|nr:hypothetical protein [Inmirania thermothiophila]ROR34127.1 hypothetical protein EDC57_0022 [Inmirania thermothiophila]